MNSRSDNTGFGEQVELKIQFRDNTSAPTDLDTFPSIQIIEPSDSIYLASTSAGVYRINVGLYGFVLSIPINGPEGKWHDMWDGVLGGTPVAGTFDFNVYNYDIPNSTIDGYEQLGDEPVFTYSVAAIHNINILMSILKRRLQSSGRHKVKDGYGNWVYENCDIFSTEELTTFLSSSLSDFNSQPHFTDFHWEDQIIIQFRDVIVEGAYILALASKALIEKGREFTISDNGLSFQPPAVADLLNSQMSTLLATYRQKLKDIKHQFKSVAGLGTLRLTGVAPQILRLRHLRARRIL